MDRMNTMVLGLYMLRVNARIHSYCEERKRKTRCRCNMSQRLLRLWVRVVQMVIVVIYFNIMQWVNAVSTQVGDRQQISNISMTQCQPRGTKSNKFHLTNNQTAVSDGYRFDSPDREKYIHLSLIKKTSSLFDIWFKKLSDTKNMY